MMRTIKKLALRRNTIRSMNDIACELEVARETCTVQTRFISSCIAVVGAGSPPD